jgi:protein gp37
MHPDWVRSIRDQCAEYNVPFFFKQWGEYSPGKSEYEYTEDKPLLCMKPSGELSSWSGNDDTTINHSVNYESSDTPMERVGKKAAGRILDGCIFNQLPVII